MDPEKAKGFLQETRENMPVKQKDVEKRFQEIEQRIKEIEERLKRLEKKAHSNAY